MLSHPPRPPTSTRRIHRGRFAPTPNGPLHFGSAVAALASFLQARRRGGQWHVRLDDVDRRRAVTGAEDGILRDLERLGLGWDGPVMRQSARTHRYAAALDELAARRLTFPCGCTRREVGPGPYPGTCRDGLGPGRRPRSLRIRTGETPIEFVDGVLGPVASAIAAEHRDFIVYRADGVHAYHLAMVVDDADLTVTEVVRGGDLLSSAGPQIFLQRALRLPTPDYAHLPVAVDAAGRKLGKRTRAEPIAGRPANAVLWNGLNFLGQGPPDSLRGESAAEILEWGIASWNLDRVPKVTSRAAPASCYRPAGG